MKTRFLDIFYENTDFDNFELREMIRDASTLEEAEEIISKNGEWSYYYAKDVLKKPFPKGENIIATNAELSYMYAKYVLRGPFLKGENVISTDVYYSYMYVKHILKEKFEKSKENKTREKMFYFWKNMKVE